MIAAIRAEIATVAKDARETADIIPFPENTSVRGSDVVGHGEDPSVKASEVTRDHAWQHALQSHLPSLRRYAGKLSRGNQQELDDLVQDCIVRALSAGVEQPPRLGKVGPWLLSILHNHFINGIRQSQTNRKLTKALTDTSPQYSHPTQHIGVELRELAAAVDQLPETQRTVLLMVCVEELSYKETAAALNIPIGTVMSTLARARQSLRALESK